MKAKAIAIENSLSNYFKGVKAAYLSKIEAICFSL